MKRKLLLFSVISFITFQTFAQKCLPVKGGCTYQPSNEPKKYSEKDSLWVQHYFYFDEQDRLVTDSVYTTDAHPYEDHLTKHYRYSQDTVFTDEGDGNITVAIVNKNGWPVERYSRNLNWTIFEKTTFNSNGELLSIIIRSKLFGEDTVEHINKTDSIVYINGNIVSCRTQFIGPQKSTTPTIEYFTFYDKYPPTISGSNNKILLLKFWEIGGGITLQPYCKNLINTTSFIGMDTVNRNYDFDKSGNLIGINVIAPYLKQDEIIFQAAFEYSCK
jgi:hypothetical protein